MASRARLGRVQYSLSRPWNALVLCNVLWMWTVVSSAGRRWHEDACRVSRDCVWAMDAVCVIDRGLRKMCTTVTSALPTQCPGGTWLR
jgi:hypothetical protein